VIGYARALELARPRRAKAEDPYSEVPEAQRYLERGVQGYGEQLQPQILQDIGSTLGGLNAIGGLRSGGTTVALGDIGQKYAGMIGSYAKMASERGLEAGLEARRQRFAEQEAKRKRKAALLGAIGNILGAGVGFLAGGPAGAAIGGKLGGGLGGSDATYAPDVGGYA
jgi:hypothetical protein